MELMSGWNDSMCGQPLVLGLKEELINVETKGTTRRGPLMESSETPPLLLPLTQFFQIRKQAQRRHDTIQDTWHREQMVAAIVFGCPVSFPLGLLLVTNPDALHVVGMSPSLVNHSSLSPGQQ